MPQTHGPQNKRSFEMGQGQYRSKCCSSLTVHHQILPFDKIQSPDLSLSSNERQTQDKSEGKIRHRRLVRVPRQPASKDGPLLSPQI